MMELFLQPDGETLCACPVQLLLFPHLPCQACPDGHLVPLPTTAGVSGWASSQNPTWGEG